MDPDRKKGSVHSNRKPVPEVLNAPRRTQAQRTRKMRARLSKAAYEVVAKRGHSEFRMSAISEQAGVSQGALLHHFPNKNAVTLAAVEYSLETDFIRSTKVIKKANCDAPGLFEIMYQDFKTFFESSHFWVALDITMDASKSSDITIQIREVVSKLRRPIYENWVEKFVESGVPRDRAVYVVRTTAALISGNAMRSLWTVDQDFEFMESNWKKTMLDEFKPGT